MKVMVSKDNSLFTHVQSTVLMVLFYIPEQLYAATPNVDLLLDLCLIE